MQTRRICAVRSKPGELSESGCNGNPSPPSFVVPLQAVTVPPQGGLRTRCRSFAGASLELRRLSTANLPIVLADELQNGPLAGVSQPRLGQPHDARIAAIALREARGDGLEQDPHRLLVAQQQPTAAASRNDRRHGDAPLPPLFTGAPRLP